MLWHLLSHLWWQTIKIYQRSGWIKPFYVHQNLFHLRVPEQEFGVCVSNLRRRRKMLQATVFTWRGISVRSERTADGSLPALKLSSRERWINELELKVASTWIVHWLRFPGFSGCCYCHPVSTQLHLTNISYQEW